jgi:hypothetical protein
MRDLARAGESIPIAFVVEFVYQAVITEIVHFPTVI